VHSSYWARNVDLGQLVDTFLVSAVTALLGIRFYLFVTGYPKVGGGGLHIAHMLWGGLFMVVAILLQLSFVGRRMQLPTAVLGGVGFGLFIDELGKFLTSNNDYFFRPTASVIYVLFVLLFMATRTVQRRKGFSEREYLVNAIDLLKEAALQEMDANDKQRADELLARAGNSELALMLRRAYREIDTLPSAPPSRLASIVTALHRWSDDVVEAPWFTRVVIATFLLQALLSVVEIAAILALGAAWRVAGSGEWVNRATHGAGGLSAVAWIAIGSALASSVFVLLGVAVLRTERARAYRMFERSLLISIFVTQVFVFYEAQFAAAVVLAVDLPLLAGLQYMLAREVTRSTQRAGLVPGLSSSAPSR
jgi:hypothetical protein